MKLLVKNYNLLIWWCCAVSFGQVKQYTYQQDINGITEQWHTIMLPDEVFGRSSQDLKDLRIFGITPEQDTLEAPYLLQIANEKTNTKLVDGKLLNSSKNENGYYFTFEIPALVPINEINLDFKQANFDWKVKLEGSQNLTEWFTVVEDYRMVSLQNELTDFQFTTIKFPTSTYRYVRIRIDSKAPPELASARLLQTEITEGTYHKYPLKQWEVKENKETKQSEITLQLPQPVPISQVTIHCKDSFDYYRPITIQYLSDSTQTEQGWIYHYKTLGTATLNSFQKNEFQLNSTTVQQLKITVHNQDNQALAFDTVEVKGYVHSLIARFTTEARYFLAYGNKAASSPQYDINRFANKIPDTLTTLSLGRVEIIEKEATPKASPLFVNQIWLWIILGILFLVLGWFTLQMMKGQK